MQSLMFFWCNDVNRDCSLLLTLLTKREVKILNLNTTCCHFDGLLRN